MRLMYQLLLTNLFNQRLPTKEELVKLLTFMYREDILSKQKSFPYKNLSLIGQFDREQNNV